jgi:tetratricopeptide (TPR) repeat protein
VSQKPRPNDKSRPSSSPAQTLSAGLQWHQAGELKQAEAAYRQVLERQPDNDEALHLLGVLMHQAGRHELAQQLIKAAIKLNPASDTYYFNLGEIQRAIENLDAAIDSYQKAIDIEAAEADYFFGLGTALYDAGRHDKAVAAFRKAILLAPDDPLIHNNLGNALAETGDLGGATQHYLEAIYHDSDYAEAYGNLGNVQKENGEPDKAVASYRKALSVQPNNGEIHYNLALALDESEVCVEAMAEYRQAIALNSSLPEAHASLGRLLREINELENAAQSYQSALELNPELHSALLGRAAVYRDSGDFTQAAEYYQRTLEIYPDDVIAHTLLGDCLAKLDRYDQAIEQIDKALAIDPENAEAYFNRGVCLQAVGSFDEAVESHRRALVLKPDLVEAAYNLVLISSESLDSNELEKLVSLTNDKSLDQQARINLHFTLAKTYKDRGSCNEAFAQLRAGNDLKARDNPFRPEIYEDYIERVIATFDAEFFETHRGFGLDSELPVFIVGMPRSGSTLVEQIISSHPCAYGAGELNDMRILVKRLPEIMKSTRDEPECVAELSPVLARQLASEHLDKLYQLSAGVDRVCDKMLGNFLKLGLIYLLFPRARIIHCMRNPLDMGLSCYFHNFARGLRFTYNLEHLGFAYRGYRKLMEHWRKVLPMPVLEMPYEQVVAGQEQASRELIEFCGLDWDSRCLDFHRQSRGVKTASFWQVRQPLYNSSVGQWRDYEQQLAPLIEALGDLANEATNPAS